MSSAALVAVDGVAPGIGKSTLVEGLVRAYVAQGYRVDLFAEADILDRPAYAEVARQFRATGRVTPDALLAATADYLDSLDAAGVQVAVLDALLPFVPSLLAWGYDRAEISRFLGALTVLRLQAGGVSAPDLLVAATAADLLAAATPVVTGGDVPTSAP